MQRSNAVLAGLVLVFGTILVAMLWPNLVALDAVIDRKTVGFNIITAVGTALGAVGAGIAAVVAAAALTRSEKNTKWAVYRDTLYRFSEGWDKLQAQRKMLADEIKAGIDPKSDNPNADVILNFLDALGFMANNDHLDMVMCWSWFYDETLYVWNNLFEYIKDDQSRNPLQWIEILPCLKKMHAVENIRRVKAHLDPAEEVPKEDPKV